LNKRFLNNVIRDTVGFNESELEKRVKEQKKSENLRLNSKRRKIQDNKANGFYEEELGDKKLHRKEEVESSQCRDQMKNFVEKGTLENGREGNKTLQSRTDEQSFLEKAPLENENSFIPIGPSLITENNSFLVRKKARGRGSIGSNRLDQYFAGLSDLSSNAKEDSESETVFSESSSNFEESLSSSSLSETTEMEIEQTKRFSSKESDRILNRPENSPKQRKQRKHRHRHCDHENIYSHHHSKHSHTDKKQCKDTKRKQKKRHDKEH